MDYYLFIVSSLNHPIYRQIQDERRELLKKYKIPYTVLINENSSSLTEEHIPTDHPMRDDEVFYPIGGYNPGMTQKFLYSVKLYFRSFRSYEDIPTYIVRINATVFINFPALHKILKKLPNTKVLAGPSWDSPNCNTFINGMIMIFSKDVLWNILKDPKMNQKEIIRQNDDVALSILSEPYSKRYDLMPYFVYPNGDDIYDLKMIDPYKNEKWFYRIWSGHDRSIDKTNFRLLKKYFSTDSEEKIEIGDRILTSCSNKEEGKDGEPTTSFLDVIREKERKRAFYKALIFYFIAVFSILFLIGMFMIYKINVHSKMKLQPKIDFPSKRTQNTRRNRV